MTQDNGMDASAPSWQELMDERAAMQARIDELVERGQALRQELEFWQAGKHHPATQAATDQWDFLLEAGPQ